MTEKPRWPTCEEMLKNGITVDENRDNKTPSYEPGGLVLDDREVNSPIFREDGSIIPSAARDARMAFADGEQDNPPAPGSKPPAC
jgi:hypothetical protein